MKYVEIMGYLATIISISSFLPIIINIYKTKKQIIFHIEV
jgi:uncharacterized protein with PQ loop repeat